MYDTTLALLCLTALTIGVTHTLMGPDHYVPFAALAKTQNWSTRQVIQRVLLCGIAHIGSSILIGTIGILGGKAIGVIEFFESSRAEIATHLLIAFGLFYFVYGLKHAFIRQHDKGDVEHTHSHDNKLTQQLKKSRLLSGWALFIVFVFGPCEALVPLLMYPAATNHWFHVVVVCSVFSLATICTMLVAVFAIWKGLALRSGIDFKRFSHATAGGTITACGLAMKLGL